MKRKYKKRDKRVQMDFKNLLLTLKTARKFTQGSEQPIQLQSKIEMQCKRGKA